MEDSSTGTLLPFVATYTILLASGIYWFYSRKATKSVTKATTTNDSSTAEKHMPPVQQQQQQQSKLKNVWDAPRNQTSQRKVAHSSEKPFGSSYYYAHNNPNATGGYKDGLKMEDYTMNGPRLLAKGGKPVDDQETKETDNYSESAVTSTMESRNPIQASILHRNITKYLWDDPGDSNGIATIRIDYLPSLSSPTDLVEWKDVSVDNVQAELVGEGMRIRVHSPGALYELKIPKLYGDAASVNAVVKPKRLLIKITKKKASIFSKQTSNLDAWPQPHRKV